MLFSDKRLDDLRGNWLFNDNSLGDLRDNWLSTTIVSTTGALTTGGSAIVAGRGFGVTSAIVAGRESEAMTTGVSTTGALTTGATDVSMTTALATGVAGDSTTGAAVVTSAIFACRVAGTTTGFLTTTVSPTCTLTTGASCGDDMFCARLSSARRIESTADLSSDIDTKKRPSASDDGGLNDSGLSPLVSATQRASAPENIASNCIAPTVISPASLL